MDLRQREENLNQLTISRMFHDLCIRPNNEISLPHCLKWAVDHSKICYRIRESCEFCQVFYKICLYHAKRCPKTNCTAPFCEKIKSVQRAREAKVQQGGQSQVQLPAQLCAQEYQVHQRRLEIQVQLLGREIQVQLSSQEFQTESPDQVFQVRPRGQQFQSQPPAPGFQGSQEVQSQPRGQESQEEPRVWIDYEQRNEENSRHFRVEGINRDLMTAVVDMYRRGLANPSDEGINRADISPQINLRELIESLRSMGADNRSIFERLVDVDPRFLRRVRRRTKDIILNYSLAKGSPPCA